jgi:hypothetical protein
MLPLSLEVAGVELRDVGLAPQREDGGACPRKDAAHPSHSTLWRECLAPSWSLLRRSIQMPALFGSGSKPRGSAREQDPGRLGSNIQEGHAVCRIDRLFSKGEVWTLDQRVGWHFGLGEVIWEEREEGIEDKGKGVWRERRWCTLMCICCESWSTASRNQRRGLALGGERRRQDV